MPTMDEYLQPSVSNGRPDEQAWIRRWWHEQHNARGRIVWEYHLDGFHADAIWFQDAPLHGAEEPGKDSARLFPLGGERIVLCEARAALTLRLVGQALVYSELARRAGAELESTVVLSESGRPQIQEVPCSLGLTVVVSPLETVA